jgi:hypothetical protein
MIPDKYVAHATRFATYDKAANMADTIAADDPDWDYGVQRLATGQFVIAVHDTSDDEFTFLGYL